MKGITKDLIKSFVVLGILIVLTIGVLFGAWWLKREINYNLMYKSMVQETIREMVKKEALN